MSTTQSSGSQKTHFKLKETQKRASSLFDRWAADGPQHTTLATFQNNHGIFTNYSIMSRVRSSAINEQRDRDTPTGELAQEPIGNRSSQLADHQDEPAKG